jgi:hypothetical protein
MRVRSSTFIPPLDEALHTRAPSFAALLAPLGIVATQQNRFPRHFFCAQAWSFGPIRGRRLQALGRVISDCLQKSLYGVDPNASLIKGCEIDADQPQLEAGCDISASGTCTKIYGSSCATPPLHGLKASGHEGGRRRRLPLGGRTGAMGTSDLGHLESVGRMLSLHAKTSCGPVPVACCTQATVQIAC